MQQKFEDFVLGQFEKNFAQINTSPYHLLVLVTAVGNLASNASLFFEECDIGYINVNSLLSGRLAELPHQQRSEAVMPILRDEIDQVGRTATILANLGILFDRSLSLRPLKILQELAKDRTIVAIWQGQVVGGKLIYAEPNHPEYRCEPIDSSFLVVNSSYEV